MIARANFPRAADISAALLDFLQQRLKIRDLVFAEGPEAILDGWVAEVYRFRLGPDDLLPEGYRGPLVVHAYSSACVLPALRHEMEVYSFLRRLNYPVPRPIFLEESPAVFGGPFTLMEWVRGQTLVDLLLRQWVSVLWAPARMAEAHARLHGLPHAGFPDAAESFLDRSLTSIEAAIRTHGLAGLAPGLAWLDSHRPADTAERSIVHLDFHPINLIFDETGCKTVLDWSDADVGDRHADIASTLMLMKLAPIEPVSALDRVAKALGKGLVIHNYLHAYRKLLPIDDDRLHYYMAWAVLRRLALWGTWRNAGPRACGIKPSSLQRITPRHIHRLCGAFVKRCGVALEM